MVRVHFPDNIDYSRVFERYLSLEGSPTDEGNVKALCPFHEDDNPSLSVNVFNGYWKCFGCEAEGDIYKFLQDMEDISFKEAKKLLDTLLLPIIKPQLVSQWFKTLLKSTKKLTFLTKERGLSLDILKRFQIGWDKQRITIPIRDHLENCVNVRRYDPGNTQGAKIINYKKDYGTPVRLYPLESLVSDEVWIMEGEMDTLLAIQHGLSAITTTAGASAWLPKWDSLFANKKVRICYDTDRPGEKGAVRVAKTLVGTAAEVKIIRLELKQDSSKDFTDYMMVEKGSIKALKKVANDTEIWKPPITEAPTDGDTKDDQIYNVHLSQASKASYAGKRVTTRAVVAGKAVQPFIVPKKILLTCPADSDKCGSCGMVRGKETITISSRSKWILELMNLTDGAQQLLLIKFASGVNCKKIKCDIQSYQNVEVLTLIPEVDFESWDQPYCMAHSYYVGHGLKSNSTYALTGMVLPDPKNQAAVTLFDKAKPAQGDISTFTMTDKLKEDLKIFQRGRLSVEDKINQIHDDFEANVTAIYDRRDLAIGVDLVYHSILQAKFQGKLLTRGWLELLVLGDPRTGKSETAYKMAQHYRMGEIVTGENTSFAGLIGGLQQVRNTWYLTWGAFPLNHKRLVILDEVSALDKEEIARLSGIRSSGVAEIVKIQREKTPAQVRSIWLSNPRRDRGLGTWTFGILGISDLIGQPEDVARFDFAITVANNEVPMDVINAEEHTACEHVYTGKLCRSLILWAWSRTADQVTFEKSATQLILQAATEMGDFYSPKVPLVQGEDMRIKLARLSMAVAARLFSTSDGEILIVKKAHVEFVLEFLEQIYSKPSMGYYQYSEIERQDKLRVREHDKEIEEYLRTKPELVYQLQRTHIFRSQRLAELLGCMSTEADEHIGFLSSFGLLTSTTNGFVKHPELVKVLIRLLPELRAAEKTAQKKRGKNAKSRF